MGKEWGERYEKISKEKPDESRLHLVGYIGSGAACVMLMVAATVSSFAMFDNSIEISVPEEAVERLSEKSRNIEDLKTLEPYTPSTMSEMTNQFFNSACENAAQRTWDLSKVRRNYGDGYKQDRAEFVDNCVADFHAQLNAE